MYGLEILVPLIWQIFGNAGLGNPGTVELAHLLTSRGLEILVPLIWLIFGNVGLGNPGTVELA